MHILDTIPNVLLSINPIKAKNREKHKRVVLGYPSMSTSWA